MGQKHKRFREFPLRDIRENPRSNVRACAAGDGAICSKNRNIVPYHGANPNTRNGACLPGLRLWLWLLMVPYISRFRSCNQVKPGRKRSYKSCKGILLLLLFLNISMFGRFIVVCLVFVILSVCRFVYCHIVKTTVYFVLKKNQALAQSNAK